MINFLNDKQFTWKICITKEKQRIFVKNVRFCFLFVFLTTREMNLIKLL